MHNLFLVYFVNLYMFRAYLGPSSGYTTVCIQQLVLIILFIWLSVVLVDQSNQNNIQLSKKNKKVPIVVYVRLYILMMGLDTCETCRGWRNILRISCASSWFFFTRIYRDAQSTKQNKTKKWPTEIEGRMRKFLSVFFRARNIQSWYFEWRAKS